MPRQYGSAVRIAESSRFQPSWLVGAGSFHQSGSTPGRSNLGHDAIRTSSTLRAPADLTGGITSTNNSRPESSQAANRSSSVAICSRFSASGSSASKATRHLATCRAGHSRSIACTLRPCSKRSGRSRLFDRACDPPAGLVELGQQISAVSIVEYQAARGPERASTVAGPLPRAPPDA